jgi:uncharacterized protein (UPF0332 family)
MTLTNNDLVKYRLARAFETLDEAKLLATSDHWNAVANRLYYAAFYAVCALLISKDINYKSHNGVKKAFHEHFIKNKLFSIQYGILYNRLFNNRQEGDYIDFQQFSNEEIEPYISETKELVETINAFLS